MSVWWLGVCLFCFCQLRKWRQNRKLILLYLGFYHPRAIYMLFFPPPSFLFASSRVFLLYWARLLLLIGYRSRTHTYYLFFFFFFSMLNEL